eukprot:gnl/TRDRNA2_/TRDRNA2_153676_c4_seq1.p1 gnl/TRDRNA2_/TRDRNA2_153676_c4~~gnl/TRDRNA2_/TRDRNA2_153676_c4_seq1.p1  ORF type:complete len:251 (+),score=37.67 gnl/TRDRNA2_/TRDRNA2_153676_c4_seq1:237-989(+)
MAAHAKKLARASGCILEYVGNVAYMAGARAERRRAREYLGWLMKQRHGPLHVDVSGRKDITVLAIPDEMRGMTKASTLRDVERETGTFCFFQGDTSTAAALLICGANDNDRSHAEAILQDIFVRGAARPKPRKRVQGGGASGAAAAHPGMHRPAGHGRGDHRDDESSDESDSGSETASESDLSSQSEPEERHSSQLRRGMREPAHGRGGRDRRDGREGGHSRSTYSDARRRQWASEESNSESDEEIVPYW